MATILLPKYKGEYVPYEILCDSDPDELAPIEYALPDPPNRKDILNYNLPAKHQIWHRPDYRERIKLMNAMTDRELDDFAEEEERRRDEGFFLYINGKITYLTGQNYFYLNWWHLDVGYPEYRARDRRWFYMWNFCEKDPDCFGMIYGKHRREGATWRAGCLNFETISRSEQAHGGIQSKTGDDAMKVFQNHIIVPWRKLPGFWHPIHEGTTFPKSSLRFFEPSEKITQKNRRVRQTAALESWIDYEVTKKEAYDSQKLKFAHLDEAGKMTDVDFTELWKIIRECLNMGRKIIGKALVTSTVADQEKGGGDKFHDVWKKSDTRKRDDNGRTLSGLYRYFSPAWDCLEDFVDHWGNPMVEEAKRFLDNKIQSYKDIGDDKSEAEERRLYPQSVKDMFMPSAEKCPFNVMKLSNQRDLHSERNPWRRYNLEWEKRYDFKGNLIADKYTQVLMQESENGRFWFRHPIPKELMNQVGRDAFGKISPLNNDKFALGVDPYDHKTVKDQKRASNGAIHAFRKWDPAINPLGTPIRHWTTNKFYVQYCARPPGGPKVFYDDVAKLIWLLGSEILIEKNKIGLSNYLEEEGLSAFIANRPESTFGVTASTQKKEEVSVAGSELLHEAFFAHWAQYIEEYYELLDNVEMIDELLSIDPSEKLTKFDKFISSGLALCQARKFIRKRKEVPKDVVLVKVYDIRGNQSKRVIKPNGKS